MKQLSTLLFLLTISFLSRSQTAAETHNFITYDTSYNIGYANLGYQIRITRPANLFTPNSPDTASRPVIIHMSGVGEIGTNSSVTATFGPHYWLANGWDGGITLGNGKHYPIIITIQSWTAWPGTTELLTVLNYLLKNYHIKRNAVHLTGLSMGAFSWTALICHQSTPGAEDGMKIVTSIAALEGQSTNVSPGVVANELPDYQSFAVWAQKYHGKFFGLEGINDYRNVSAVSQAMNAVVPGCAYFSYENIGGGAHCCWNSMYDPSVTNWTSVGTLGPNNATQAAPNTMGDYTAPCNIFTWMLRQGDTSLVGGSSSSTATANAGGNQTLSAGTTSTTLSGSLSLGSLLSYSWTQVSGPNTAQIASPSSVTTAITGLITGTYVFTLKVSTVLGISASAQVSIVVSAPANIAPTANAGADISMTLPTNTATLSGSGADQDGTIKTYVWSQVSGPSQAGLTDKGNGTAYVTSMVAGTYVFRLTVTDNSGATATDDMTIVVNAAQLSNSAPPTTTYISVPGIVQAESYASMSGIGTETTTDDGGGLDVGWIDNGDWMSYNINAAAAGSYVLTFRVASIYSGASFQVKNSTGTVLATVNPDNTGGWQNWESITATVTLPAGNQTLTVVSTTGNGWNLNWIQFAAAVSTPPSTGKAIPGTIEAESYDAMSGIATETTGDTGGGLDVGWIDEGDWMKYNVTVATAGTYTVNFRVATIYNGAVVQLKNAAGTVLGSVTLSSTGSFQNWTTVSTTVQLPAGAQTLEIYSPNTLNWNINWMSFVAQGGNSSSSSNSSGSTTTNTGVGGATPTLVPGRVEAEKYYEVYGTLTQANASASGGANQGWIDNGNWMAYIFNVPTAGTYLVNFRVSTVNDGGVIQMKTPTGSVLLTLSVPNSGDWNTWETVGGTVTLPAGIQTMVVWNNAAPEWNFDWMEIVNNTTNASVSGGAVAGQATMMSTVSGLADPNSTFAVSSALFPNPANDHTILNLNNKHVGKMTVDVINVAGKAIRSYQYNKDQVSMQVTVATSDLPAGTYFIRVQVGDWVETQKLLKK